MKSNKSKYKLVVDYVIDGINEGRLKKGAWIPSLNEFREMYGLSRDTVFSGIRELKSRGIIKSNPGSWVLYRKYACSVQTQYISAFQ